MVKRTRAEFEGEMHDALELDFDVEKENWNIYLIEDGTKIRMRLVVAKILKIEGKWDQEGNPIYSIKSGNMVVASSPDHLLRPPKEPNDE